VIFFRSHEFSCESTTDFAEKPVTVLAIVVSTLRIAKIRSNIHSAHRQANMLAAFPLTMAKDMC